MTLKDIAQQYAEDAELGRFAEYCRLKALGLRRDALTVIDELAAQIDARSDVASRFRIVHRLFEIENDAGIHKLLPHTFVDKVMRPACEAMSLMDSQDPRPYRWLGFQENWRKALELDPGDFVARARWSAACWKDLDYALHELPAGLLCPAEELAETVLTLDELSRGPGGNTRWMGSPSRGLARSYLDYESSDKAISFEQWAARCQRPSSLTD